MKIIKIDELKPGMCFSKPLIIDPYNKLIDKEIPLTKVIIDALHFWKINEIETEGYRLEDKIITEEKSEQTEIIGTYGGSDSKIKTLKIEPEDIIRKSEIDKEKKQLLIKELRKTDIIPYDVKKNVEMVYNNAKDIVKGSIAQLKKGRPIEKLPLISAVDRLYNTLGSDKVDLLKLAFSENKEYDYEDHLYTQLVNTCIFSLMIGKSLNLDIKARGNLGVGALLHDIGMFIVPSSIIAKNGKLSEDEYDKIKTHPFLGYKILVQVAKLSQEIAIISLQHQELFDGSGYPKGLKANEINILARIVSITSVFSSLIRTRAYREYTKPFTAMTKMLTEFKNKFDSKLLNRFVRIIGLYPISTYVLLNNGYTGQVVEATISNPKKPKIKIMYTEEGLPPSKKIIIDLSRTDKIYVEKALSKFEFEKIIVEEHEKLQQ